ncbi:MAG TPA: sensor histidine kinase [Steroidobacteraceae bacterium]|jgi:two-component system sensor histidine kinase UhpB|nr:sensor histidine kinase [Steroidobacteraceae bacterium]
MRLRTRLNLVVAGLSAAFVAVLIAAEIQSTRTSVREEIEAANRVASQLLGRLAALYSRIGGPEMTQQFLEQLGRVRANEVYLIAPDGKYIYRSPPPTYKAGREAPMWFAKLMDPRPARYVFPLRQGVTLVVEAQPSRAVLDAWDDVVRLCLLGVAMLVAVNVLAFWLVDRVLRPFPVIASGLERIQQGDLAFRLPELSGTEAHAIGLAFNRMAQAVEDKVLAERKARDAEARLDERQEMASLADQRVEEERRLIAHELHDEFGQSVTAIRSLAQAIATQSGARDPATAEVARLISEEAARLYDAMHGLIPRLTPLSLDTLGLAATLDSLVRDWQRRHPAVALSLDLDLPTELGPSVSLAVYRVVQEGLINALRHSQASRIDIEVRADGARIAAKVSDDGVGLPADWTRPGHFGLRGLGERVRQLGGTFTVANRDGRGVELHAEVPLGQAA